MVKKNRQPPSKNKYDKTHPIVSVRVDQKVKEKLDEIRAISGKSLGDIIIEDLKVQAPSTERAFKKGIDFGQELYGVSYKCSVCGGTIWIDTPEQKKAAAQLMRENKWRHGGC